MKPTKDEMLRTISDVITDESWFLEIDGEKEDSDKVKSLKAIRSIVESWPWVVKREIVNDVLEPLNRVPYTREKVERLMIILLEKLGIPVED